MSWTKDQKNYGVLKIEGKSVKVYSSSTSNQVLTVGEEIQEVRWNGDILLVSLKNGKVRRYNSMTSYTTV